MLKGKENKLKGKENKLRDKEDSYLWDTINCF